MQSKFSFYFLLALMLILAASMFNTLSVLSKVHDELLVVRAQTVSHAEALIVEKDVAQLQEQVGAFRFQNTMIEMRVKLLENTKPEVNLEDMQKFATDIDNEFNVLDKRMNLVEKEYIKNHKHQ